MQQVWDIGGQETIRRLWRHYYANTDALIFVIDSQDTERMKEAKEELHHLLSQDELRDASVLVYANKQDAKGAMTPSKMADALGLHSVKSHTWYIQGCSAVTGDGLHAGLDYVVESQKKKKK